MKKIIIISLTLFIPFLAISQAVISFEKNTHDFGKIKEEDGRVNYEFVFKNEGNAPLVISNVKASCGCTSPSWTKTPIEPGKEGVVTVAFNPLGRPGNFHKHISVMSNATVENEKLYIKGEVIPKPKKDPVTEKYPIDINGLRLSTNLIEFNNVEKGIAKEQSIKAANTSDNQVVINFNNLPNYISVSTSSLLTLAPNTESEITLIFDSQKTSVWGPISHDIYLTTNTQKENSPKNKLTVNANIVEDFSNISIAEKRTAPILEIQKRSFSFGAVNKNSTQKGSFSIRNVGEKPLSIRRVINNNSEISFQTEQLNIRSGKSSNLTFTVNTAGLNTGKYKRAITLMTNDPENVYVVLAIEWEIK